MKSNFLISLSIIFVLPLFAQKSSLMDEAKLLERQFKTNEAIRKYESLVSNDPTNIPILVRLAELYCMEGQSKEKEEESKLMYGFASKYAEKANVLDSNRADVQYANAMVIGKMIQFASIKDKTRLTMVLREKTDKALAIDPDYIKAIYTLAKWNDEVASLNPAARAALKIMNKGFPAASSEEAVRLYEKARKLDPAFIVNNHDLALAYKKSGKPLQAIELLNYQLRLPAKTKEDQEVKLKSKQLLESLK
jgi:tetratricopeptide (TPR) repeat protein